VNLTLGHVLIVAVTTVVGASLGRFIRRHSRRLQFLNEVTRAALFLLGITAAVVLVALSRASSIEKAALVGFYIGAVYGLVASEPRPPHASGKGNAEAGTAAKPGAAGPH
jgi:membrane associated rhomboid family serine protease